MDNLSDGLSEHDRERLTDTITANPAYRLANRDPDLLQADDLRPVRLQLELLKPERAMVANNVTSTVVVFGSARIPPPDVAAERLAAAEAMVARQPDDPAGEAALMTARKALAYSRYYDEARRFAQIVSRRFQSEGRCDFVVVTGGGPGIMESANRGAFDVGARSIGLNITLPQEQAPNPFITPELCFQFRYFALRKMHFLMRAKALVAFPGGFGTLDELFGTLTLVQTGKVGRMPIVLVGEAFWRGLMNFDLLVDEGMIAKEDKALFSIVETAEQAVACLRDFYQDAAV
ncbi:MAG TPA: TIGR00730 family Rossman fold protein [Steroidobacteraceae bacterium]|nr:TIGR00730 family Rossman fold protein [Steroidobacteraceae bacterium]